MGIKVHAIQVQTQRNIGIILALIVPFVLRTGECAVVTNNGRGVGSLWFGRSLGFRSKEVTEDLLFDETEELESNMGGGHPVMRLGEGLPCLL